MTNSNTILKLLSSLHYKAINSIKKNNIEFAHYNLTDYFYTVEILENYHNSLKSLLSIFKKEHLLLKQYEQLFYKDMLMLFSDKDFQTHLIFYLKEVEEKFQAHPRQQSDRAAALAKINQTYNNNCLSHKAEYYRHYNNPDIGLVPAIIYKLEEYFKSRNYERAAIYFFYNSRSIILSNIHYVRHVTIHSEKIKEDNQDEDICSDSAIIKGFAPL